ncbi:MAG: histidinol dehydrogenase, partial [Nocardioides sp.]
MLNQLKAPTGASSKTADPAVSEVVREVLEEVRAHGDDAVRRYSEKFDNWSPESFLLDREQIEELMAGLDGQVIEDIRTVQTNVRDFAQRQRDTMQDLEVETQPGVHLGHKHLPIAASGAYVPGGRYPLTASAHMTVVTAKVAGVERVTACTPPLRGVMPAATVAALHLAGADEIFLLGGVQAVAAMALGTESVGRVDLIAGPGNAYVAEAKRQLFGEVGIDLFAGPTE